VLSGGSLHGAFGAGFFLGLQDSGNLPPEADVVTGVSTGSLQSTFLFLARPTLPSGSRDYRWVGGAAMQSLPGAGDRPPLAAGRSDIEDLALAYTIRKESDILEPAPLGDVGTVITGSMGTLGPLRKRLMALISEDTVHAVAVQACRGRKLFVGVTNVDDGEGYALDLTALALRAYDGHATAARMTEVRKAYVASLIASSSVPVGARPVSLRVCLDNCDVARADHRTNLFVDGGARFGVFLSEISDARSLTGVSGNGDVTLIVNTDMATGPWHSDNLANPRDTWLMTTLGLRTVDILENQVYQLSVALVEAKASHASMAYISNEHIDPPYTGSERPDDHAYAIGSESSSCAGWKNLEKTTIHPIQFYPKYMSCLLDYGRERGELNVWNFAPDK
jgi:hypothetical protein